MNKQRGKKTLATKICGVAMASGLCMGIVPSALADGGDGRIAAPSASKSASVMDASETAQPAAGTWSKGGRVIDTTRGKGKINSWGKVIPSTKKPTIAAGKTESTPKANENAKKQSIIVPAYKWPDAGNDNKFWDTLVKLGGDYIPYVVVNPSSGPGDKAEPNYVQQMSKNTAAGIKNVAYIRMDYQRRPISEVKAEVDRYYSFYGESNVSGFFFDEADAKTPEQERYLAELYSYVKSKHSDKLVIANFGAPNLTTAVTKSADIFVTAEYSQEKYLETANSTLSAFEADSGNSKHIMHIVYGASPDKYKEIIDISRKRNAGWLYVTSDTQSNPYDELPADMENLARSINDLGMPDDPRK